MMKVQIFFLLASLCAYSSFASPNANSVVIQPTYASQFGENMFIEKTLESIVLSNIPFSQVGVLRFDFSNPSLSANELTSFLLETLDVGETQGVDAEVSLYWIKTIRDFSKPDSSIEGVERELLMKTQIKDKKITFDLMKWATQFWGKSVIFEITYGGINSIIISSTPDKKSSVATVSVEFGSKIPPVKTVTHVSHVSAVGYSGGKTSESAKCGDNKCDNKCADNQCQACDCGCDCKCKKTSTCCDSSEGYCTGKRLRKGQPKGVIGGIATKKVYPSAYYSYMGDEPQLILDSFPLDKSRNLFAMMGFDLAELNKVRAFETATAIRLVTHCFVEKGKSKTGVKLELHLVRDMPHDMDGVKPSKLITELLTVASSDATGTFNIDLTAFKNKLGDLTYVGFKFQSGSAEEIILQSDPPMSPIMYLEVE